MGLGPEVAHHKKKKLLTEINMVPFIDIVLVLLIIFMILSPFLAQSKIPVNLPQVTTERPADVDSPLKIQVTREGDFHLEGRRILRNSIEEELRKALAANPARPVLIEADRDVSFKHVVLALDAAEACKAAKVGVAVLAPTS